MQPNTEYILGDNIRKFRKDSSLSQAQLAEALGVSQSAVYYWETGKREPGTQTILSLCDFFHISPNDLYGQSKDVAAFDFSSACSWLKKSGFSVYPDEETDSFQILSSRGKIICHMSQAEIIKLVNLCVDKADVYRSQLIIEFIRFSLKKLEQ